MKKLILFVLSFAVILPCLGGFAHASKMSVSAKSAIVIEAKTGRILYAKNARAKLPMASTTKIMTALLALEQPDIDESFVVDENAIMVEGTSMGLKGGDTVTLRTLAVGMLLASGNDGANAAAVKISGSIADFIMLMNSKAKEIGMADTNFETPSGLDSENHYSTAHDMALLGAYAMENQAFADICGKTSEKVTYGNPPYKRTLSNHNRLLKEYDGCVGVKTGFTKKSGRCLVSAAERGEARLVAVTLNAGDDWNDHKRMLDYGFSVTSVMNINNASDKLTLPVVGAEQKETTAYVFEDVLAALTEEQAAKITTKAYAHKFLYAPVPAGTVAGRVDYLFEDKIIATANLVVSEDIQAKQAPPKKKSLFGIF
jgi:D-alanyl-D-alanine carboxypeptidase